PRRRNARLRRISVTILRGCVPMHEALNGMAGPGFSLVHSTDLSSPEIRRGTRSVNELRRHAAGPCVLLPRVGSPARPRCTLYLGKRRIVLSDCVFALLCESNRDARRAQCAISENWASIASRFGGTCAPYLTVSNLRDELTNLGFQVN